MREHFAINAYDRERSWSPHISHVLEYLWALGLDLELTVTGLPSGPVVLDCYDDFARRTALQAKWKEVSDRDQTLSGRRTKPGVRPRSDTTKRAHTELSDRDLTDLVVGVLAKENGSSMPAKYLLGRMKLSGAGLTKRFETVLGTLVADRRISQTTRKAPHSYKLRQL
jgi:hypothetical protein